MTKKEYYELNKEIIKAKQAKYREANREKLKKYKVTPEQSKKYREKNTNKIKDYRENNKKAAKVYREKNKEAKKKYMREYMNNRLKTDNLFKLRHNYKRNLNKFIRLMGNKKNTKTINMLGCSYEQYKKHIESLWESWMTWDNYGLYNGIEKYGWDIDHLIPSSSAKTEEDLYKLFHYTNLQPLCSKVNRDIKKDSYY